MTVNAPHVLVIMMENRSFSQVIGASSWPHVNAFATAYSQASSYTAVFHPSLPNYLAIVSGSRWHVAIDGTPTQVGGPFSGSTLVDELATASISWKAYFEDMPSVGYTGGDVANYRQHHNPFVYFSSITGNATQLNNTVPYTQSSCIADLNSTSPPAFVFLVPNMIDDGHNGTDTQADNFLNTLIPAIQGTSWYTNNGIIIVVWDESVPNDTAGIGDAIPGGGKIACVVISAFTKGRAQLSSPINHFGLLRGLCELYNVPLLLNAAHTSNGDLTPLLGSVVSVGGPQLSVSPTTLAFTGTASGTPAAAQSVTLTNSGGAQASYSAATSANWLTVTPKSGTLGVGASIPLSISASPAQLAPGTYTGSVTYSASGTTATVNVALTVSAGGVALLSVSPLTLAFSGVSGGTNPATQTVTVTDTGTASDTFSASTSATWLTVSPTSGSLSAGGSTPSTVGVVLSGLATGLYTGTVTYTDGTTTSTVNVALTVTVPPPPTPPPTPPPPTTTGGNPYGGGWIGGTPSSQKGLLGVLVKSGAKHLRYQLSWLDLEPSQGTYNWAQVDDLVNNAGKPNNLLLTFIIQNPPAWRQVPLICDAGKLVPDPNQIGTFVDVLTKRYPPGTFFSIEVNNEGYNTGNLCAAMFSQQLLPSLQAVRPIIARNTPTTLLGGPADLDNSPVNTIPWWQLFYQAGCHKYCDYLNIHFYPGGSPDDSSPTHSSLQQRIKAVTDQQAIFHDTGRPIWITETGWTRLNAAGTNGGVDPATIGTYITTLLTESMNSGIVKKVIYFNLNDIAPGAGASQNFTLPCYTAWANFISAHPQWGSSSGGGGTPPPPPPPPPSGSISVTPTTISFTGVSGGSNPAAQNVTLTNTGNASITYTAASAQSWISVTPASGTLLASGSATSSISVNLSGLTPGTYSGSATWTANGNTVSTSIVLFVTSSTPTPPPPPPPGLTVLTVFLSGTPSSTLPSANMLYTLSGGSAVLNTATTLGTAKGWGEVTSQGTTAAWFASTTTPPRPTNNGFLWDSTALEGNDLVAGTYTASLRLNTIGTGATSITADIHCRIWKRLSGGTTYNLIADTALLAQTIQTTSKGVFLCTGTTTAITSFAVGDKLYLDVILNVLTNTGAATQQIQLDDLSLETTAHTGNTSAQVVTPGYQTTGSGTGKGPTLIPLSVYGTNVAATTIATANKLATVTGGSE